MALYEGELVRYREACEILEVTPGASVDEVKRAYRKLAQQTHPDRAGFSESKVVSFHQVQDAYKVLLTAAKRRAKQSAVSPPPPSTPLAPNPPPGSPLAPPPPPAAAPPQRKQRLAPARGPDVRGDLRVSLQEIFLGTATDISFPDVAGCERCGATGGEPGFVLIACPYCRDEREADCGWCRNERHMPDQPCQACEGAGVLETTRTVRIGVPRSSENGRELLLPGRGKWGMETRGDLRLRLVVEESENMRRAGDELEVEVTVGVLQAVLGGHAIVPTLEGVRHKISISSGSSSGKRFRLRGQGFYRGEEGSERGDLYAILAIAVPESLTPRQLSLYQQLLAEELKESA